MSFDVKRSELDLCCTENGIKKEVGTFPCTVLQEKDFLEISLSKKGRVGIDSVYHILIFEIGN